MPNLFFLAALGLTVSNLVGWTAVSWWWIAGLFAVPIVFTLVAWGTVFAVALLATKD